MDPSGGSSHRRLRPGVASARRRRRSPLAPGAGRLANLGRRILPFIDSGEPAGFAPARWGGRISLDYLDQRGEEGLRRHVSTATASLNAASYFWQPWFARCAAR